MSMLDIKCQPSGTPDSWQYPVGNYYWILNSITET